MSEPPAKEKKGQRKGAKRKKVVSEEGVQQGAKPKYSAEKPHPGQWRNDRFEEYYQRLVPPQEWESFIKTLRDPLPITFWINPLEYTEQTVERMRQYAKEFHNVEVDGVTISFAPLPFFDNDLAWQCVIPKSTLRRSPKFAEFHRWLIGVTLQGLVNRQEAVSMLPPLFMDVHPEHCVLDMCAAPGSKSAQLLQSLANGGNHCGLLIANDADYGRSELLVHQIKRFSKLFPLFLCVNQDARYFPNKLSAEHEVRFDRILCDVMCTGDGTLRKSPNSWKSWNASQSLSMSKKQRMVLRRAVEMLKVGGRTVYSTCSMNPVENEAVVAYVLRRYKGALRLVDTSALHPEVKRSSGLTTWIIPDSHGDLHEHAPSGQEMKEKKYIRGLKRHFFPPTEDEVKEMNLERCMRFWPHTQNTGGFFIAVIEKISEVEVADMPIASKLAAVTQEGLANGDNDASEDDEAEPTTLAADTPEELPSRKVRRGEQTERYRYEKLTPEMSIQLARFYQCEGFPTDRLYFRCVDSPAAIGTPTVVLLVCPAIANLLDVPDVHKHWNIVNCGLPLFEWDRMQSRESSTVGENYRVKQQSVEFVASMMGQSNRLVEFDAEFLGTLLQSPMKRVDLPESLQSIPVGGMILSSTGRHGKVYIAGMRARGTLNAMVADEDVDHMLDVLGVPKKPVLETTEHPSKKRKSETTSTSL